MFFSLKYMERSPALPVELGGKTLVIEAEVVDAPIDYNILLGWSWMYEVNATMYSVFQVIKFPLLIS